jgi:hypothetical protein
VSPYLCFVLAIPVGIVVVFVVLMVMSLIGSALAWAIERVPFFEEIVSFVVMLAAGTVVFGCVACLGLFALRVVGLCR